MNDKVKDCADCEVILVQINEKLEALTGKVNDIEEGQKSVDRALRGHNGKPGLVTQVTVMSQNQDTFRKLIANLDIKVTSAQEASKDAADQVQRCQLRNIPLHKENTQPLKKDEEKNGFGSWGWFRDKGLQPVFLMIITYIALEVFKHTFVP